MNIGIVAAPAAVLVILLSACDITIGNVEQRSIDIVKMLTSKNVDVPALASLAGWPEGSDPQTLLGDNGPHVSLLYIKNNQRKGITMSFGIQKAELLSDGSSKSVLVQVKKKSYGLIVAKVELVFNREDKGKWVLAAIDTDG